MTSPLPPPNPNQPFAQGQQGNVQGSDGSTPSDSGGSIIDDVGSAIGGAVSDVAGGIGAGVLSGLTGALESIMSGMAHTVNVILNNLFYAGIVLFGGVLMVAGFWMLINATPAGAAVKSTAGSVAGIAGKVLPI